MKALLPGEAFHHPVKEVKLFSHHRVRKFGCGAPRPQISHPRGPGSHRGLEPSTQLSKHSRFVAIITTARTRFNSAGSQEQYFNNPHLVLVFSTGIFTSELFFNSTFEALFKVKELAAAHVYPRGYSCMQSHQMVSPKRSWGLET